MDKIVITNKEIIRFYNNNKNIDIVEVNLLYIKVLEKLSNVTFDNTVAMDKIFSLLNNQSNEINHLKEIQTVNASNIKNELLSKIYETKDSYINEIKNILKSNNMEYNNNIDDTINKQNEILLNKLQLHITDNIPKSCATYYNDITLSFKKDLELSFQQLKQTDPNLLITNINNIITDKYSILNNNINNLNEMIMKGNIINESTNSDINKFFKKYSCSSFKGEYGEIQLNKLLVESFPSGHIIKTTNLTGKGDFVLERYDKENILIETKEYTDNVKKSETDKFLRDCTNNNCNGLFLSQSSGIVNKSNYQIDIHNNKILVYIHNMNYDKDKLLLGIQLIDLLSDKFYLLNDRSANITIDNLKNINNEIQQILSIKDKMLIELKDYYKKTVENINKLNTPDIQNILDKYFANSKRATYVCELCKKFESTSLRSMARHKTSCKKKYLQIADSSSMDSQ